MHMFGDWLQGFNSVLKPVFLLGRRCCAERSRSVEMTWFLRKKNLCSLLHVIIEAFKLDYPSARGYVTVGCGGITTLDANDYSIFFGA
jgi:hypothetical protein